MSSTFSPTSLHPAEWQLPHVCRWLQTLQPPSIAQNYTAKFREQGIEGDILLQLGVEALRELGVTSVGHRLILLRAIYELKRKWGIELEPESWRPDVAHDGRGIDRLALPPTIANVASVDLIRALQERDERVWVLEQELARLVDWLRQCTDESMAGPSSFKLVEPLRPFLPPSKAHSSFPFAGLAREDMSVGAMRPYANSGSASAAATAVNGTPHSAPLTADPRELDDGRPSSRGMRTPAFAGRPPVADREREQLVHSPQGVPKSGFSQTGLSPTHSNTPSATPTTAHPSGSMATDPQRATKSASAALAQANGALQAGAAAGNAALTSVPTPLGSSAGLLDVSGREKSSNVNGLANSSSSAGADSTYKSFRVTLDDPCYKVLPAALKKYKINDDWRQYALFICYGTTERCLSYDEKPLLLFQKLKENKQSPVFMLRHIRDVKSPIAIANAKAAARKSTSDTKDASMAAAASGAHNGGVKVADAVAKFSGISKDAPDSAQDAKTGVEGRSEGPFIDSSPGQPRVTGPASQLPDSQDSNGNVGSSRSIARSAPADTYSIAIYPYVSEREDEFDVAVGDTFIVKSKAKGWWVVQRDARATGQAVVEGIECDAEGQPTNGGEIRSGWVPAGCLLETRQPLTTIVTIPASLGGPSSPISPRSPGTPHVARASDDATDGNNATAEAAAASTECSPAFTAFMASVPIPPSFISSTSTEGILLMDYNDAGEKVHLKKERRLRVFKRYNHWSYCVEEGAGHVRAWLPSWYIGKVRDASTASTAKGAQGDSGNAAGGSGSAGATKATGSSASTPMPALLTSTKARGSQDGSGSAEGTGASRRDSASTPTPHQISHQGHSAASLSSSSSSITTPGANSQAAGLPLSGAPLTTAATTVAR